MNAPIGQKNRPWKAIVTYKNGESSTSIVAGQCVVLSMSGTDDGYAVVLPSTAGAAKTASLFKGIAAPKASTISTTPYAVPPGTYFNVIIGGYCPTACLVLATKAASTAAWPSYAAGAIGDMLYCETVNNGLVNAGSVAANSLFNGVAVLLQTYASATTAASSAYTGTVAASATALTVSVAANLKVFA